MQAGVICFSLLIYVIELFLQVNYQNTKCRGKYKNSRKEEPIVKRYVVNRQEWQPFWNQHPLESTGNHIFDYVGCCRGHAKCRIWPWALEHTSFQNVFLKVYLRTPQRCRSQWGRAGKRTTVVQEVSSQGWFLSKTSGCWGQSQGNLVSIRAPCGCINKN